MHPLTVVKDILSGQISETGSINTLSLDDSDSKESADACWTEKLSKVCDSFSTLETDFTSGEADKTIIVVSEDASRSNCWAQDTPAIPPPTITNVAEVMFDI